MSTLNDLVELFWKGVNPDVLEKIVKDALEFGLTATERQSMVIEGCRIRLMGKDVGQGAIVVRLLERDVPSNVLLQTVKCLADLSIYYENQVKIASFPSVLDAMVRLLRPGDDSPRRDMPILHEVHEEITKCLANLAVIPENQMAMASYSVLDPLVTLLRTDRSPGVHLQTLTFLTNLAVLPTNLERIASYPGALHALVRLLGMNGSTDVRTRMSTQTLKCLINLAELRNNQPTIASEEGMLDALVRLLGKIGTSDEQNLAARLLTRLADNFQGNKIAIASHPGVLDVLGRLLKCNWTTIGRIHVQGEAAMCLSTLASVDQNLVRIASHRGTLDALVSCLGKLTSRKVQIIAVKCFDSLAVEAKNHARIVLHPGAVAALARMLVQDANPHGLESAASCLCKLATSQETRHTLASNWNLVEALVKVLENNLYSDALLPTIRCIGNLAVGSENQVKIVSHPGVLDALVRLLKKKVNAVVLEQTTKCFYSLAEARENQVKIATSGALGAFVNLLTEKGNYTEYALEYTVKCLAKLAKTHENKETIASCSGMLNAFVMLLRTDGISNVKEHVLRCLAKLSEAKQNRVMIASYPGVHDALRKLATNDVNSWQAHICLSKLGYVPESKSHEDQFYGLQRRDQQRRDSLTDPDLWCVDPIRYMLMCDPVKCSDGRTYDRWTIIDGKIIGCPYDAEMTTFTIVFDDIDVRKRLFQEYPEQEEEFRRHRKEYREEALQHAHRQEFKDAIEKLSNVLKWAPSDTECQHELKRIENILSDEPVLPLNQVLPQGQPYQNLYLRQEDQSTTPPAPSETYRFPVIMHDDVIRDMKGARIALIMVLLYVGIWFIII